MLFIDFSSAFNTIIPQQLTHKLVQLGLNTSLCNWLLDFLTGRPQAVRVSIKTSSTITLNTGAPQCVLSPLLFTLLTHDCTPSHNSNLFIKFADDTTVVGLISNRDETNYRSEVSRLAGVVQGQQSLSECGEDEGDCCWLQESAHSACSSDHQRCDCGESEQHQVPGCFTITEDLSWTNNTAALAKKAQQRLYFLRKLRRARARPHHVHLLQRHHREHPD